MDCGVPDLIVKATEKSQIISLIKLAREKRISIIPKSSRIDYYDGSKAEVGGILIDMSQMKRIVEIREGSDRCVTIEPGVTFEELQEYLNPKGFKCMVPLGVPCQASVLSSYLERVPLLSGPIILLSEGSQCIMDMEVARGDGTTLHTGSGETVPTRPGISPNGPIGPDWTRIFTAAQGTMGIVTEMTIKFKHVPEFQKILLKPYDFLEDLLTDMTRIKRIEVGKECLGVSNLNMASILARNKEELQALREILPKWTLVLNLTGWETEEIEVLERDLEELGIKFSTGAFKVITNISDIEETFLNEFNLPKRMVKFRDYTDYCQVIPFYASKSSIVEYDKEIERMASKSGYDLNDLHGYLMPIEQARIFYFEYTLHASGKDSEDFITVQNLFEEISEYIINQGGIIDRPYGIWSRIIYSKIPGYMRLLKAAKKILDPNGIFNPGKIFQAVIPRKIISKGGTIKVSNNTFLKKLQDIVGIENATDDPIIRFAHTRDQFVKTRGPDYVVVVSNKVEIAAVLKLAYQHNIPVVPKGTGANISGAVIPEAGGIILDLKKMDRILEIDKENMTATVEPGVSMGQLQIEAWKHGLFVPEPSGPHSVRVISNLVQCRGISTYSAKYGVGDAHVLGYEWVLPNGEITRMGCYANPAGEKSENWQHVIGPDLSGAFLFAFGTLGVCVKAKIKLYPKMEDFEAGIKDKYVSILGPLESCFRALQYLVKYGVYSNAFLTRWPYISMIFGRKKKDSQTMMKNPAFGALVTFVLEGTERRIAFNEKRLRRIIKENFKDLGIAVMDEVHGPMIDMTAPGPNSMLAPIRDEPRRLIDFMFLSARAFRVHGAFGGNTPLLSLDDAHDIFTSTEKAATEYAPRPHEMACYFQPIDDYHYGLQEMDLYFDMFDPEDFQKSLAAHQIGSYYNVLRRRDSLVFYIYFAHDFNEAVMPLLAPGYMRLLKNWKSFVDPDSIMNRKKGILADKDYLTMEIE